MPLEPHATSTMLDSLAGYPRWLVAACLTIVAAAVLWVFAKLLKWSLYLMLALVLVAGVAITGWLIFH